jgi:diguanylate cyclase (GGDEF)-like protein
MAGFLLSCWIPALPGDAAFGDWPSEVVMGTSAALIFLRAFTGSRRERLAWLLIGTSIVVWVFGDVWWLTVLAGVDIPPIPSPADVGYLLFTPLAFAGLVLLLQARTGAVRHTIVVDGVIAGLAIGSLSASLVLEPVADVAEGNTAAVVTNLLYPILDVVLLGVTVGAIAMRGWRFDRTWSLLAAGTLAYWVADSNYLLTVADGTYITPSAWDAGWMGSTVLYALAAWQPALKTPIVRRSSMREIVLPLAFGVLGLTILIAESNTGIDLAASGLAGASMLAIMARLMMTHSINLRMLRASQEEALTDPLTGLGNRRALMNDIELKIGAASDAEPLVLVLFDLDGFKHYNDSFGHPAGDELLARMGRNLSTALIGRGAAYRMGGDEFCALIEPRGEVAEPAVQAAASALSDKGEGFSIGCSYGVITLPREADGAPSALRIADQRMYAAKQSGRMSAGRQSKEVLLRALAERDPYLGGHTHDVAGMAAAVARLLGLSPEEVDEIAQAAELHDVGKVAIPDAILHKPGPLEESDWHFIRRHTLIGERIIAAAPSLGRVATLVRSTHERYDGNGYPDGLAGLDIPLGARIVAVCDAFDAMTTDRPYRVAVSADAALNELRAHAGTQFDPVVVEAFDAAWVSRPASRRS